MLQTLPDPAVLVVAHGDGGDAPADASIRALAEHLRRTLRVPVTWATLKRPASLAAARLDLGEAGARPVIVYPFFMVEGWFVATKLPKAIAEAGFTVATTLPAFGVSPGIVDLVADLLAEDATAGRKALLVAHGSGDGHGASAEATGRLVAALHARGLTDVTAAYIEQAPFYDAAIAEGAPATVIGLFASAGTHALDDVAFAVAAQPSVTRHIVAIGEDPRAQAIVARAVAGCISALVR